MIGRIVSKAKYELSKAKVSINTTLSADEMKEALQKAVRDAETTEQQLERYPFIDGAYIAPDYVIRHDTLVEDLRLLLQAFECRTNFGSRNMHSVETDEKDEQNDKSDSEDEDEDEDNAGDDDETLSKELDIPLTMKDKRHRRMLEYARRLNRVGLEKAVKFRNVDGRGNNKQGKKASVSVS